MSKKISREVFEIQKILDNPIYEGFGLEEAPSLIGRESLDEDINPSHNYWSIDEKWSITPLKQHWKTPKAAGRVRPFNDFPCLDLRIPAFSERACEQLKDMLEPNGELLPLKTDTPVRYYFYNITTLVDALDIQKSKVDWWGKRLGDVDYYSLIEEKLQGLTIFRLSQFPTLPLVTEDFVHRVEASGLNGFDFIKIWPLKRGVRWQQQPPRYPEIAQQSKASKQQTLVLIFPLEGKKPNPQEKKAIKRFEDELDAQLVVPSLTAPYFGNYEGNEKLDGEVRLFLTCPDAKRLEQKLRPWILSATWPVNRYMMLRFGDMYDENAEELLMEVPATGELS